MSIYNLNGTYTREILAISDFQINKSVKLDAKRSVRNKLDSLNDYFENPLNSIGNIDDYNLIRNTSEFFLSKQLDNASTVDEVLNVFDQMEFPDPEILAQKMYQIYIDNWHYPADDENLKFDIGALYNKNSLSQCWLDGFFWALPFDVDPYAIALQIQDEERRKKAQLNKTFTAKTSTTMQTNSNQIHNKNLDKNTLNKLIDYDTTSGIELKVKSLIKGKGFLPYTTSTQTLTLNLKDLDWLQTVRKDIIKRGLEDQSIIDSGGTIIKSK